MGHNIGPWAMAGVDDGRWQVLTTGRERQKYSRAQSERRENASNDEAGGGGETYRVALG
jgi:hypothetical protein